MTTTNTASPIRRLEFVEESSNKVWKVRCEGNEVVIRYDRIGSA